MNLLCAHLIGLKAIAEKFGNYQMAKLLMYGCLIPVAMDMIISTVIILHSRINQELSLMNVLMVVDLLQIILLIYLIASCVVILIILRVIAGHGQNRLQELLVQKL